MLCSHQTLRGAGGRGEAFRIRRPLLCRVLGVFQTHPRIVKDSPRAPATTTPKVRADFCPFWPPKSLPKRSQKSIENCIEILMPTRYKIYPKM